MSQSPTYKNFRDGTITLTDGTGSPITLIIQFEPGDFSASGFSEGNHEVNAYLDRGEFASLRKTVRTFPTFSFTAYATDYSDATDELPADAVQKLGAFAAGVSTLGTNADAWTCKVVLDIEGTTLGDPTDHQLDMDDCRLVLDFSEGDPSAFVVNGTCYGAVAWT